MLSLLCAPVVVAIDVVLQEVAGCSLCCCLIDVGVLLTDSLH